MSNRNKREREREIDWGMNSKMETMKIQVGNVFDMRTWNNQ